MEIYGDPGRAAMSVNGSLSKVGSASCAKLVFTQMVVDNLLLIMPSSNHMSEIRMMVDQVIHNGWPKVREFI